MDFYLTSSDELFSCFQVHLFSFSFSFSFSFPSLFLFFSFVYLFSLSLTYVLSPFSLSHLFSLYFGRFKRFLQPGVKHSQQQILRLLSQSKCYCGFNQRSNLWQDLSIYLSIYLSVIYHFGRIIWDRINPDKQT